MIFARVESMVVLGILGLLPLVFFLGLQAVKAAAKVAVKPAMYVSVKNDKVVQVLSIKHGKVSFGDSEGRLETMKSELFAKEYRRL